jgi:hypothetical protein
LADRALATGNGAANNSANATGAVANLDMASAQTGLRIQTVQESKQSRSATRSSVDVDGTDPAVAAHAAAQIQIDATETTQATGLAIAAGAAWWALRAGGLMASLAVSLPAWRHADLLAVLPDPEDEEHWDLAEDDEAARDEQALRQMLEPTSQGDNA